MRHNSERSELALYRFSARELYLSCPVVNRGRNERHNAERSVLAFFSVLPLSGVEERHNGSVLFVRIAVEVRHNAVSSALALFKYEVRNM